MSQLRQVRTDDTSGWSSVEEYHSGSLACTSATLGCLFQDLEETGHSTIFNASDQLCMDAVVYDEWIG